MKVECLRTLDRLRLEGYLTPDQFLNATEDLYQALESVELVPLSDSILERASSNFSVILGSLDAIHLASAIEWRNKKSTGITFLTHDTQLSRAAKSLGISVLGNLSSGLLANLRNSSECRRSIQ